MRTVIGWIVALVLFAFVRVTRRPSFTFKNKSDGSPYLTRWPLATVDPWPDAEGRTGGEGWYLHLFHSSDYEREPHSHPSAYGVAFPLVNGYRDERVQRDERNPIRRTRTFGPLTMNVLTGETFHRVELLGRFSVSLFYMGPRNNKSWGFLQDDGTVRRAPHNDGNTGESTERDWTE